jgi:ABC-type glycerol-3-phosphate transport system substrate-binding protein
MRLTSNFVRTAVTGAAALALLTACGGGSDNASSSSSATTTTSSSPTTTAAGPTGADAAFCAAVPQLTSELAAVQAAPPQQGAQLLQQLVADFGKVTPPAAIQADWRSLGNGLSQLVAAVGSMDLSTPQGQQQYQQAAQLATQQAAAAQGNISTWVLSNCGSGASSSTSAATTS